MKRLAPAAVALAFLGMAPAAQAADMTVFDYFSAVCLKHVWDLEGARAEALALGFTPYKGKIPNTDEPPDAFMKETSGGRIAVGLQVSTQDGERIIPPADQVICGVSGTVEDAAAAGLAARWAGVPEDAVYSNAGDATYFFSDVGGVRRQIGQPEDAAIADGLKNGSVTMMVVRRNPKAPSIMMQVSRAQTEAK